MRSLLLALLLSACVPTPAPDAGLDAPSDAADPDASTADAPDVPLPDAPADVDAPAATIDAIVALLGDPAPDAAAIDRALHEVAWGPGWPLHEGSRWLFVASIETGAPVHWTSDANGWSETASPAMRSATGRHHWVIVEESSFAVPPEGAKYKWLVSGIFEPPLEATAYGFDDFGRFGWIRPDPALPHLEQFPDLVSRHLPVPRTLRVYVPTGLSVRARTLVLHDGQNVFHPDASFGGWRVDEALLDPAFADVIALAIDNTEDRMDAYTHVADDIGGGAIGGRADDYLALVFDEALPFLRARFAVEARGDSLMMMGSSLGGLVTAYAALSHPTDFGCGAALSSTFGWGSFAPGPSDTLIQRWTAHLPTSLYVDSGGQVTGSCMDTDADGVRDDSLDGDNYCVTSQFRDVLADLGYVFGEDLTHWHEPGATHDEAAWAARVPRALAACAAMGWTAP